MSQNFHPKFAEPSRNSPLVEVKYWLAKIKRSDLLLFLVLHATNTGDSGPFEPWQPGRTNWLPDPGSVSSETGQRISSAPTPHRTAKFALNRHSAARWASTFWTNWRQRPEADAARGARCFSE